MILATALAVVLAQVVPFNETIDVRVHNVDVIVTDAQGRPVPGLRAADFELLENGVAQRITNFAEFSDAVSAQGEAQPEARTRQAQRPPPRKFVFFIDEMTLHPSTRRKFSDSVNELLVRSLREGDEAMIVRPSTPEKLVLQFTSDREAIRAAVSRAMMDSVYRTNSAQAMDDFLFMQEVRGADKSRRQVARRFAERERRRVEQRLANLRAIVAALSELQGRKVLIAVTELLPTRPGRWMLHYAANMKVEEGFVDTPADHLRADYVDLTPVIADIATTASANGITIYCLQPEFSQVTAPGSVETKTDRTAGRVEDMRPTYDRLANDEDTMNRLAEATGGKWFRGDTRIDNAFRQVELDVQSYYSMAYHGEGAADEVRKVEVRVRNRPELRVRARGEVIRKSPRRELSDRVVASLVYPPSHNALGISAAAQSVESGGRVKSATVDVRIPLDKLAYVDTGGIRRASFTVHYAIAGERTDFVSGTEPEQVVEIPVAKWESARNQAWTHTLRFNMRRGSHRLAIGVLDSLSQEWGIEALKIDAK